MSYPELERCIEVVKALRHPQSGCPWDLEQTHESLLKFLIEEAYEYIEAVEEKNFPAMEEELGDVLFQVILHSTLAEESRKFNLESSAKKLADKLIRRHPHVFQDKNNSITSAEVIEKWREIKKKEKGEKKYYFDESYLRSPSLESSYKIGVKSQEVNFDWDDYQQVVMKVEEEWQEVKEELPPTGSFNKERVEEEIGDLLFSVAQLARHLDINPETCLRKANKKFISRFKKVEDQVKTQGNTLQNTSQEELERFWNKVKNL